MLIAFETENTGLDSECDGRCLEKNTVRKGHRRRKSWVVVEGTREQVGGEAASCCFKLDPHQQSNLPLSPLVLQ